MKSAYLYISFDCNSDCLFCASDKTNTVVGKKELNLEECIEFMDDTVKRGLKTIIISGGEPTVHKDVVHIVEESAARFREVYMASNGIRFANSTFARRIVEAGLSGIGIPIYSTSEEKFDYLVQHSGAFQKVRRGIHNLFDLRKDYNLGLMLKILVMRPNYQENPDIVKMIKDEFPEPDSICIAGLRVGEKAFKRKEEFFVPYDIARPYTTETARRVLPYKLSFDFLPLCALEPDFVANLIKNDIKSWERIQNRIKRPDNHQEDREQPFHYEACCMQCDVYDLCSKVHTKNAEDLNYNSQLRPIKINS